MRWQRSRFTPTAWRARLSLVAVVDCARLDEALDRARAELDDEAAWDSVEVELRARGADGGRFEELLAGRPSHGLESLDAAARFDVAHAKRYVTIDAGHDDSPWHRALQAAMSLLRALALEEDLQLALDCTTARWWSPPELAELAPDRAFDLDEHVRVVVEQVERRPGVGHLVRTRGLGKMARPDVCLRAPRGEAERLGDALRVLAERFADGEAPDPAAHVELLGAPLVGVPRSDDCLADAPLGSAPLWELRDVAADGTPGPDVSGLRARLRPRTRLRLV